MLCQHGNIVFRVLRQQVRSCQTGHASPIAYISVQHTAANVELEKLDLLTPEPQCY